MAAALSSVGTLLMGVLLVMIGHGLLNSLTGLRLDALADTGGVAELYAGFASAGYFAGLTVGSLHAWRLIARFGHIRAYTVFTAAYAGLAMAQALWLDPVLWTLWRFMAGLGMAGLFICIESWLNARASSETRGGVLALYIMTNSLALTIGQLPLLLPDPSGYLLFCIATMGIALGAIPVALTGITQPVLNDVASFSFRRLWRISPMAVIGCFASGLITGALYGLGAPFVQRLGHPNEVVVAFMMCWTLGGLLMQWPLGRLSDRLGRRPVMLALFGAVIAFSLAVIAAASTGWWLLLLSGVMFGTVSGTLYPVAVAHANDHARSEEAMSVSGGMILTYSVGAILGPLAASVVMTEGLAGPRGLFVFAGAVGLTALLFTLWRLKARPAPVEAGAFQPQVRTTPMVAVLDPRTEGLEDGPPAPVEKTAPA